MRIASVDTTNTPTTATPTGNSQLGKDEFVKLMMAQLAHQDPSSPQSNEAFIAQLAQFATVELMQQSNANLESLIIAQAAGNQTGVAQLVGKEVLFRTNEIALTADGTSLPIAAHLPEDAANVVVTVKDESGRVVRSMQLGAQDAGSFDVAFDGRDDQGNQLPAGTYTFEVSATSLDGSVVDGIVCGARGHVDGVSFANGAPELILGSLKIALNDVVEISEPSTGGTASPSEQESP
jgi:flagellar basal-body rod modification protein FlgD